MMYVHADSRIRKSEPVPESWREILLAFERQAAIKI
jgi:hypothetical protein